MEYMKGVHNLNLSVSLPYIFPLFQLNYTSDSVTEVDSPMKPVQCFQILSPYLPPFPPSLLLSFLSIFSSLSEICIYMKGRTKPCIFILPQIYLGILHLSPLFHEAPILISKVCEILCDNWWS